MEKITGPKGLISKDELKQLVKDGVVTTIYPCFPDPWGRYSSSHIQNAEHFVGEALEHGHYTVMALNNLSAS
jgi:hypothetical protein